MAGSKTVARPIMIVVAGPPGSGKSTFFPVGAMGVDAFSIDDRCAQIIGSYRAIPPAVRKAVSRECERFVDEHIANGRSFAVETTMRTLVSVRQVRSARRARASARPSRSCPRPRLTSTWSGCFSVPKRVDMRRLRPRSDRCTRRPLRTLQRRFESSIAAGSSMHRSRGSARAWSLGRLEASARSSRTRHRGLRRLYLSAPADFDPGQACRVYCTRVP